MSSVQVAESDSFVPDAPAPRRRRWMRPVGLVAGALLVLLGALCVFTSVETSAAPVVNCGPVAVEVMFDASQAPPGRVDDCRGDAAAQVVGGSFAFLLPGVLLVAGPTLGSRRRRREQAEIARMREAGVWRFHRFWRVAAGVIGGGPLALLLLAAVASADVALIVVAVIIGLPWAVYCYLTALRPEVRFEDAGLVVVNPMSCRLLFWGHIAGLDPGYWGTGVTLRNGETVNVWVGQKTNWARWRGTATRADAMAAAIAARIQRDAPVPVALAVSDPGSAENRRRGRRNMVLGAAAGVAITIIRIRLGS